MTTSFASIDRARAISTICCSATDRAETGREGSRSRPTSRVIARAARRMAGASTKPRRVGSRPMKTFFAIDSEGTRLNSW